MLHRHVARLLLPATLLIAACTEHSIVQPPLQSLVLVPQGAKASIAGDGSVPYFPSEEDVPDPFWRPVIHGHTDGLFWSGATVTASGYLDYYGNRATGSFHVTVSGIDNGSRRVDSREEQFWPERRGFFTDDFSLFVHSKCGNTAVTENTHTASITLDVTILGSLIRHTQSVSQPGDAKAVQPACGEREEIVPSGGGGGGCLECPAEPVQWCAVRYRYDIASGEVLSATILYCF